MKKKILVVEDEIIVAMDLQMTLIELGYEVPEVVISGEAAIQIAHELRPDLVLMDIHLSEALDGITAAAHIRQELAIPVIYLTAYADEETLARACKTTPFGYILKPFEAKELKANLEIAFYKHHLESLAQEDRQWLLAVLNSISDAVTASDRYGTIKFMNPVAETLTGWPQAEALQSDLEAVFNFIEELTANPIENPMLRALMSGQTETLPDNTLLRTRTGTTTPVADSASPIFDERGELKGAVMVFRDITEQKRNREQLEYSALHDTLTGLPNRALFLDRLQQAVDRSRRSPSFGFTVMLLDLDRFKVINDTLGHFLGDQLLMAVAPRFTAHLRAMDTVARFGGDEFAILLEDVQDAAIACRTAERILEELEKPFRVNGHELLVTASIGIVLSSIPYSQTSDLLKDADIAMYRAKSQGRSCYELFNAEMHREAKRFLQLEHDLQQAIAHQTLQVHYQPILSLATHQVISVEALVRWQSPQGVQIPPADFIPIAEEVGLVNAIDRWVIQASCQQLKVWQQNFQNPWFIHPGDYSAPCPSNILQQPFTLNVNLSSKQFHQQNLVDNFLQILETTDLTGHCLRLEVTESVFIENAEAAATILSRLKHLGMQICLDDFGTGYSALSYLHKFPIDLVKIDRSFIQGMETDAEKREIVRAIIGLCHTLNMIVTAEGVETQQQAEILTDLGCEYAQGYFFAPPMGSDEITQLLASGERG